MQTNTLAAANCTAIGFRASSRSPERGQNLNANIREEDGHRLFHPQILHEITTTFNGSTFGTENYQPQPFEAGIPGSVEAFLVMVL